MKEEEIVHWLEEWQMYEHLGEYEEMVEDIETLLFREAGLNMGTMWEKILLDRGLIQ